MDAGRLVVSQFFLIIRSNKLQARNTTAAVVVICERASYYIVHKFRNKEAVTTEFYFEFNCRSPLYSRIYIENNA